MDCYWKWIFVPSVKILPFGRISIISKKKCPLLSSCLCVCLSVCLYMSGQFPLDSLLWNLVLHTLQKICCETLKLETSKNTVFKPHVLLKVLPVLKHIYSLPSLIFAFISPQLFTSVFFVFCQACHVRMVLKFNEVYLYSNSST